MIYVVAGLLVVANGLLAFAVWQLGSINEHVEAIHGYHVWSKAEKPDADDDDMLLWGN